MDTLTHALSGALLARAAWPHARHGRARTAAALLAAAFPDIDYLLFWLAPPAFLNAHRGATHSLLMLPLWATLLALLLARVLHAPWRRLLGACALGIAAHIAGDLITVYGTQCLWPLSTQPWALGWSFDVNLWAALIVGLACLPARRRPRAALGAAVLALGALLVLQVQLRERALALVDGRGVQRVQALPQPLSPFHWLLLVDIDGTQGRYAHLTLWPPPLPWPMLAGFDARGYHAADALDWRPYTRFGSDVDARTLAADAWASPALAGLRRFAQWPALYRLDVAGDEVCAWFTDLRHTLPGQPPPFRYGACRPGTDAPWRAYRLRYFSTDTRQAL